MTTLRCVTCFDFYSIEAPIFERDNVTRAVLANGAEDLVSVCKQVSACHELSSRARFSARYGVLLQLSGEFAPDLRVIGAHALTKFFAVRSVVFSVAVFFTLFALVVVRLAELVKGLCNSAD